MGKFNFPINNFSSGEWSPRMLGRTDTEQYPKACEELLNMIPQMTGGAQFRGGTTWIENAQSGAGDGQAYWDNITETEDPFNGFKMIPYRPFSKGLAKLIIITQRWFSSPGGGELTYGTGAASTLSSWEPKLTQFTALGDLVIVTNVNGSHKPKVVWYNSGTMQYRLDDIDGDYITSKPWTTIPWGKLEALDSNVTLNPSATTGAITITASAPYFVGDHNGMYVRFANGVALDGVAKITGVSSGTSATATVLQVLPNASFAYGSIANANSFWQRSAWNNFDGWPRTVIAHQGRLIFGGSPAKPDTLWGSRISNFFDFQEVPSPNTTGYSGFAGAAFTADNSRPFALTPSSPEASSIVALSSSKTLTIHTDRAEIVAYGSTGALGPVNVVFESSSAFGSLPIQPVRVNNYLTFVQATGRKIRDIVFNFDENQFKSTDLAFVADHYFLNEEAPDGIDLIRELSKTEANSSVLWVRTMLGNLFTLTLDRDYQITAWSRVTLGSSPENADSTYFPSPRVLAMCAMSLPDDGAVDNLYMLVLRYVNGTHRAVLEKMTPAWENSNSQDIAINTFTKYSNYLDSAKRATKDYNVDPDGYGWRAQMFNSDNHPYKGATVSVMADGNYIGEVVVGTDGEGTFVLDRVYTSVIIGFKYVGRLKTMPIEQGGQTGVPVGRQKRIDELVIRFFNSVGCKYGREEDDMIEVPFREPGSPMNGPVAFFTGDKVLQFPGGYDRKCQVIIEQDKPYPMHIIAVIPQGQTYD